MLDLTGKTLKGRYRIEALVGRGGMAEVYKAWDTHRQYHVAVKVMREDLAEDLEFVRRFRREARALAALSHANIVRFYSFEQEGRLAFIVMDYAEGTSLRGRILDAGGKPLPLEEVLSIARQVSAALHYAHSENVLHRDVKPGNIMVAPGRGEGGKDLILVTDFGIAKAADAATATTVMPGTPAYMSPEQCRSEPVDERSDVYSLGIVVYEMLAGRRPFVGDTEASTSSTRETIRWEQVHADPPSLPRFNPEAPPGVEAVLRRALAKEKEHRWPTALAFWQALASAAGEQTPAGAETPAAPVREAEPLPARQPQPEPEPEPLPPSAAALEEAAPGARAPARRGTLPPWAWVAGGVLLAGLVILALALLSGGTPKAIAPAPTATWTATPATTHTPRATATPAGPSKGDTWSRPADGMVMVYVPAGEFRMGSTEQEVDDALELCNQYRDDCERSWFEDELPMHQVHLEAYWIDRAEVTNAQFAAFMNEQGNPVEGGVPWLDLSDVDCLIEQTTNGYKAKEGYADHPVIEVTWYGAQAYCQWAGGQLPTEAQWEYAARGPNRLLYPWGSSPPACEYVHYQACAGLTLPVDGKPLGASPYGALNTAGNVWEWTASLSQTYPYQADDGRNDPNAAGDRILRGGSWGDYPHNLRTANRVPNHPVDSGMYKVGFRCAKGIP